MEQLLMTYDFDKERIDELVDDEVVAITMNEVLYKLIHALYRSRQTLRVSYAFKYFTRPCNQLDLFKENLKSLESACDDLEGYFEKCFESPNEINALREEIVNKSSYCDRRQGMLVEHMREGYSDGWWQYQDIFLPE